MDRNNRNIANGQSQKVALRKESVDRNSVRFLPILKGLSLSARRAWIEILYYGDDLTFADVALRKESVDRNTLPENPMISVNKSLSARRAWIEITSSTFVSALFAVALRKESVDRNRKIIVPGPSVMGRSPQGERG